MSNTSNVAAGMIPLNSQQFSEFVDLDNELTPSQRDLVAKGLDSGASKLIMVSSVSFLGSVAAHWTYQKMRGRRYTAFLPLCTGFLGFVTSMKFAEPVMFGRVVRAQPEGTPERRLFDFLESHGSQTLGLWRFYYVYTSQNPDQRYKMLASMRQAVEKASGGISALSPEQELAIQNKQKELDASSQKDSLYDKIDRENAALAQNKSTPVIDESSIESALGYGGSEDKGANSEMAKSSMSVWDRIRGEQSSEKKSSSWDRIRNENNRDRLSPPTSDSEAMPAAASDSQPVAKLSLTENGLVVDKRAQEAFDRELERERSGEDALVDDFTSSEKKWT
ncbi:hypothetical protein NADFUDRAFT_45013 [Nadsonia fulvescens var. elongata DSM 6958]|uniref:Transmembrane protein n=1 Tax=Nadsonia fulvescens var. elongata DSM 6958 TaxID=857566 RepID=A0A1E3PT57_9ASCO|nr:hypothetical protein NADFUDRAFT_45013 [Nadsonia fulvescens var. elongata DSM 6958]